MILPFLSGILSSRLAPVTWALFAMNLWVFALTSYPAEEGRREMYSIIQNPHFEMVQGEHFADFVLRSGHKYPENLEYLAQQVLNTRNAEMTQSLSSIAHTDLFFKKAYKSFKFESDPILTKWWKLKFSELNEASTRHPSSIFGLNSDNHGIDRAISYLFYHGGVIHLFSNMLFLLIFGTVLETVIGGLGLLMVYLFSGIVAAMVYYTLQPLSAIPLVGASGAISGLIAMFCFVFWNQNVRYFYLLLIPVRGYFGFIYLPAWFGLLTWILTDLAGYLSSSEVSGGGVAYTAHMGGELAGILAGLMLFSLRKYIHGKTGALQAGFVDTKPLFTRIDI
jgi:membrane associated rhomboid family serine protease